MNLRHLCHKLTFFIRFLYFDKVKKFTFYVIINIHFCNITCPKRINWFFKQFYCEYKFLEIILNPQGVK